MLMARVSIRFGVYTLPVPILLFYALSLTGCISTSPGITNLFLVDIRTPSLPLGLANSAAQYFHIRIGYFGACIGDDVADLDCSSTSGGLKDALVARVLNDAANRSPSIAPLIWSTLALQSQVLNVLVIASVLFLLSLGSLVLLKLTLKSRSSNPQPTRLYERITFSTLWLSTALALAAALSTTQTFGVLQYSTKLLGTSELRIVPGTALQVLQWLAFAFSAIFAMGAINIVRSTGVPSMGKNMEMAARKPVVGNGGGAPPPPPPLPPPPLPPFR